MNKPDIPEDTTTFHLIRNGESIFMTQKEFNKYFTEIQEENNRLKDENEKLEKELSWQTDVVNEDQIQEIKRLKAQVETLNEASPFELDPRLIQLSLSNAERELKELKQECKDREECEKSLTQWNHDLDKELKQERKKLDELEGVIDSCLEKYGSNNQLDMYVSALMGVKDAIQQLRAE